MHEDAQQRPGRGKKIGTVQRKPAPDLRRVEPKRGVDRQRAQRRGGGKGVGIVQSGVSGAHSSVSATTMPIGRWPGLRSA